MNKKDPNSVYHFANTEQKVDPMSVNGLSATNKVSRLQYE